MKKEFSEQDKLKIISLIKHKNYSNLENWIGGAPDRAKQVFSHYLSLKSLEEMEVVLEPSTKEKFSSRKEQVKIAVIGYFRRGIEVGLELLAGQEHSLLLQPGFVRSGSEDKKNTLPNQSLDFGVFKIMTSDDVGKDGSLAYILKLGACHHVCLEEVRDSFDTANKLYEARNINSFALPLFSGKYKVDIDGENWILDLK